ncbi:MAG: DUF362 domain-containing protein [Nitrospirae bacterium]|nr:DUF362 domain-containing protein [Nitrospirota bacterium]
MEFIRKLKRREFLISSLILACEGVFSHVFASSSVSITEKNRKRSRLVTVFHQEATDGTDGRDNKNLNGEIVRLMVNEGIKEFTRKKDLKEAWSVIIPDRNKKIAIKINCQITSIYTKAKVVKPIVDGLILRGVTPDNIIIYDKRDNAFEYAGFIKNKGAGVKVGTVQDFGGYHRFFFNRLAVLLTGINFFTVEKYHCDYLINVPVLKALDGYSGVSLSMKNHYGSIDNPYDHHEDIMTYLPFLNSLPYIREKTRLIVMDAIFAGYKWVNGRDQKYIDAPNKIIISDDPVAVDYTGWEYIEASRKAHGLAPVSPKPVFIDQAARMGLGNNATEKIDKTAINL